MNTFTYDYISELSRLMNAIPNSKTILKEIQKGKYNQANNLYLLIQFVNDPKFIQTMKITNREEKWYDILFPFLIRNIIFKQMVIDGYKSVGLSNEFISLLLYPSGRPIGSIQTYYISDIGDGIYINIFIPVIRYQVGIYILSRLNNRRGL